MYDFLIDFDSIFSPELWFLYDSILLWVGMLNSFFLKIQTPFVHVERTMLMSTSRPQHQAIIVWCTLATHSLLITGRPGLAWRRIDGTLTAWSATFYCLRIWLKQCAEVCCRQTTRMQFLVTDICSRRVTPTCVYLIRSLMLRSRPCLSKLTPQLDINQFHYSVW